MGRTIEVEHGVELRRWSMRVGHGRAGATSKESWGARLVNCDRSEPRRSMTPGHGGEQKGDIQVEHYV